MKIDKFITATKSKINFLIDDLLIDKKIRDLSDVSYRFTKFLGLFYIGVASSFSLFSPESHYLISKLNIWFCFWLLIAFLLEIVSLQIKIYQQGIGTFFIARRLGLFTFLSLLYFSFNLYLKSTGV